MKLRRIRRRRPLTTSSGIGTDDTKLPLTGGTLSGPLDLSGNRVKNLAEPAEENDAVRIGESLGLYLPPAVVSGGTLTGGAIRDAHSILLKADYTQTTAPSDPAVTPGLKILWEATLNDSTPFIGSTYGIGQVNPSTGVGTWGPPGIIEIAGRITHGVDSSGLAFNPIGFANMLFNRNTPGQDRALDHMWDWMHVGGIYADAGTITLKQSEMIDHGATFLDYKVWATANDGVLTGMDDNVGWTSFMSAPQIKGNVEIPYQIAFEVLDLNYYFHQPNYDITALLANGVVPGCDSEDPTVHTRYGLLVPHLTGALVNIGVQNASRTVEPFLAVELDDEADTIPCTATAIGLTNSTGASLTLTDSSPIDAGVDGQRLSLVNLGSDAIVLNESAGLQLAGAQLTLSEGDTAQFIYSEDLAKWLEVTQGSVATKALKLYRSDAAGTYLQVDQYGLFGPTLTIRTAAAGANDLVSLSSLGLAFGPGNAAIDTQLARAAAGVLSLGAGFLRSTANPVTADDFVRKGFIDNYTEKTTNYTLTLADQGKTIGMNNAAGRNFTIDSAVGWPTGAQFELVRIAGATTIIAANDTTFISKAGTSSPRTVGSANGSLVKCRHLGNNVWLLSGDVA